MSQSSRSNGPELLLIVVGAHPLAERSDRATAYAMRDRVVDGLLAQPHVQPRTTPEVLVCCDVWYLNDESMRRTPAISLGAPGVNACTAYLASRLPSAFVIDDVLMVQVGLTADLPLACCWGTTPGGTRQAADIFCERYLADYLASAFPVR